MKSQWRVMICVGLMAMVGTVCGSAISDKSQSATETYRRRLRVNDWELPSASEASRLNKCGLALLAQCCEGSENKTVFISPFSLDSAFALLWLGSSDPVKAEISAALGFPLKMNSLAAANRMLARSREPRILTSNSLWADHLFPLADAYSNLVNDYFPRSVFSFDNTKPEESAKMMNGFVAEKTENMISDLVSPRDIKPGQEGTGLVLINTLYFNGRWRQPFKKNRTKVDYVFNQLNGKESLVSMMCDRREVRYCETNDYQVLMLPYRSGGANCDFVAVLPTPALDVTTLLSRLSAEDELSKLLSSCSLREVDILLPKLDVTYRKSLVEELKARGLVRIFKADITSFPALTEGRNGVYATAVSEVVQSTKIKLDESGTEAAAATAIMTAMKNCIDFGPPSPPVPVFKADHPYLGFIVERETGLILFAGAFRQIGDQCRESQMDRAAMEARESKRRADFAAAMELYERRLEEWKNPRPSKKGPVIDEFESDDW